MKTQTDKEIKMLEKIADEMEPTDEQCARYDELLSSASVASDKPLVESLHSTTDTIGRQAKSNVYRGKAKDAYWRGYDAGLEHAQYCELGSEDYINAWRDDTLGEILGDIVEGYRQYSPFEFTASEFNKARNTETLWEAYDKGEYDGWTDGLVKRFGDPALIDI